ncbi:MAG: helix-turn-helix transcriptional regulator [Cyanothece sp. SIO1E1]|nr:helix-turn-helix transcriptional regulator [Cyanothece sp. SIO1E1]
MALTLADLTELWQIAWQTDRALYQQVGFEDKTGIPEILGEGGERNIYLRNGLIITVYNTKLWQNFIMERQHESSFPLVAKFYLSGSSRVQTKEPTLTNIRADYAEVAGCHYLYHLPNITEAEYWPSNEQHHVVMIQAQAEYLRCFSPGKTFLAPPLKRLLDGDEAYRFHQSLGQITPAMSQVLQQILQAPYQGMMQHLYLESKALELLALQLAHWAEGQPSGPSRRLPSDELERLHAAKTILVSNVGEPPALAALAQQVGLNEYRLKQGFRQVFGTTVFGYLHHCRMQQAQHLLLNSNLTIAGVAARVGYRNPEAFSTAFRRKFAISPKAYQLGKHS